jgi:hypothetical protein
LVPAAELKTSNPPTGSTTRTALTEPGRCQAACVASSWTISHPPPKGAIAEAARTGDPSSKTSADALSTSTRTCSPLRRSSTADPDRRILAHSRRATPGHPVTIDLGRTPGQGGR